MLTKKFSTKKAVATITMKLLKKSTNSMDTFLKTVELLYSYLTKTSTETSEPLAARTATLTANCSKELTKNTQNI